MMEKSVLAVAAHPDDIEFMMAGTMLLLRDAGWDLHYMNIANGCCGSVTEPAEKVIETRRREAQNACNFIGARYYESLCDDLKVYHTTELVSRVVSVVRYTKPAIMLIPSPQDYMEDHINAGRIAVTAAFARGMRNFPSEPYIDPIFTDVVLYHAMPYGLRTPMRERIWPGLYADISSVLAEKREMLACHRSQKEWLDESQGVDAYLDTMEDFAREMGAMSGRFQVAEGWRRRSHLGFSGADTDLLADTLRDRCLVNKAYEDALG